ncbi:MAG: hypothetical protein JWO56_2861, partial [Acidobacteria bacterium]|nr:hypothetical protein [Acidobacteriota bacterium]
LNRLAIVALLRLTGTPLFGGGPYLILAAFVLVRSLRPPTRTRHALAATIAASGLCYALPLSVLSGAADFRYLSWLVGASLVAAVLRFGDAIGSAPGPNANSASQPANAQSVAPTGRHPRRRAR